MASERRRAIMQSVTNSIIAQMVAGLKDNLTTSTDWSDTPLAPLGVWDSERLKFRTVGSKLPSFADRINSDTPLVDTGKLLNSIKLGSVITAATTSDGRRGISITATIVAESYGLDHTAEQSVTVDLGRTKAIRAARNFGSLRKGFDFVTRTISVPPRPWNGVSRSRLLTMTNNALTGARS
jgi:hypothetical protein